MLWLIIASIMVISIYSCYENVVDQNIKDFVSTPVIIPIDKIREFGIRKSSKNLVILLLFCIFMGENQQITK